MPDEPTTTLAELTRRAIEAAGRRDFDAAMSFYATDAVWDGSSFGAAPLKGPEAIRREMEQWVGLYEQFEIQLQEVRDLGNVWFSR